MDFLNQAFAQVSDLFRSMTVGARITAGLLLVVVVVSLGYLFNQRSSGPDDYLMNGEPIQASYIPAMEAAFADAGLSEYRVDGTRIRIPRGKSSLYMAALADADALPPNFHDFIDNSLDKGGVFETREVRQQRIKSARQQQLASIIQSMHDIQAAMVLYDEKEQPGIKRGKIITASVNVKPTGNRPLDADRVPALRNIVASAIAGLDPKMISVTDLNSGRNFKPSSGDEADETAELYPKHKKYYEKIWKNKIENALSLVPDSIVAVNVELIPDSNTKTTTTEYDPKPVPLISKSKTVIETNESGAGGGRPGLAAQQPAVGGPSTGAATVASANSRRSNREDAAEDQQNLVGRTVKQIETPGLQPQVVKVAIGIPNSYLRKVWSKLNPDKEITPQDLGIKQQEEKDRIRTMIAPLISFNNNRDIAKIMQDDVAVTFFEDIVEAAPIEEPSTVSSALGWFSQNLSTVSLSLLAVFGMVMLRSMVRATPATPDTPAGGVATDESGYSSDEAGAILPFAPEPGATEAERAEHEKKLKRRLSSGPSVKDELADLVKEDPDAAANILRTWISNAG